MLFWSENGDKLPILVWNWGWFSRGVHECIHCFYSEYANLKWVLRNFFCAFSNLSNDEIIISQRPGLKTGVKNDIFLV